jgi:hypothetical protein
MLRTKRLLNKKALIFAFTFIFLLLTFVFLRAQRPEPTHTAAVLGDDHGEKILSARTGFDVASSPELTSGTAERLPRPVTKVVTNNAGKVTNIDLGDFGGAGLKVYSFKVPTDYFAYALAWSKGDFLYSWNNKDFTKPLLSDDIGLDDPQKFKFATDLNYDKPNSGTLYVKTADISGLRLSFIDPAASQPAGYGITATTSGYRGATYTNLNIVSRIQWGADESKALWLPSYCQTQRFIVHHTDNANTSSDYPSVVRAIFNYHAVTLDWSDIGYNYLIDQNGVIYEGRMGGEGATGAHAYLHNCASIGIGMIGTFTDTLPSAPAVESLLNLIAEKAALAGIPSLTWEGNLFGHRDFNSTSCPGNILYNYLPTFVPTINQRITNLTVINTKVAATALAFTQANQGIPNQTWKTNLVLTFNRPAATVTQAEIKALVPLFSEIESIGVFQNTALLRIKTHYSSGQKLLYRSELLHTIFSLDADVVDIQIVGDYNTQDFNF